MTTTITYHVTCKTCDFSWSVGEQYRAYSVGMGHAQYYDHHVRIDRESQPDGGSDLDRRISFVPCDDCGVSYDVYSFPVCPECEPGGDVLIGDLKIALYRAARAVAECVGVVAGYSDLTVLGINTPDPMRLSPQEWGDMGDAMDLARRAMRSLTPPPELIDFYETALESMDTVSDVAHRVSGTGLPAVVVYTDVLTAASERLRDATDAMEGIGDGKDIN